MPTSGYRVSMTNIIPSSSAVYDSSQQYIDVGNAFCDYGIRDAYTPDLSKDYFKRENTSLTKFTFSIKLSQDDTWVKTPLDDVEFRFLYQGQTVTHNDYIIRGSFPRFYSNFASLSPSQGDSAIEGYIKRGYFGSGVDLQCLEVGDTRFYSSSFADGVIPTAVIVCLEGAGGGGASSTLTSMGVGGGSGAYICAILDLSNGRTFRFRVGTPGHGGTPSHINGYDGGNVIITTNDGTTLLTAGGGKGGVSGVSHNGGIYTLANNLSSYGVYLINVSDGFSGKPTQNGESSTTLNLYASNSRMSGSYLSTQVGNKVGGVGNDANAGGGGASMSSKGGNAGTLASPVGKDGGIGAGGGGSSRVANTNHNGGNGGSGRLSIWY